MANLSEWVSLSRGIHAGEYYLLGRVEGNCFEGAGQSVLVGCGQSSWEHRGVNQVDGEGKNGTSQVEGKLKKKKKKNGAQPCFCPLRKFPYISAPPTHAL